MYEEEESCVHAISVFLVKNYCKAWFNAPKAHIASKQDSNILYCLLDYEEYDNNIPQIALSKFLSHLLYLNAELVGSFFFFFFYPNRQ